MLRFKRKHAVDATDAYRLIFAGLDIFNAAGGANENLGASLFLNPLPQIILERLSGRRQYGVFSVFGFHNSRTTLSCSAFLVRACSVLFILRT